MKSITRWLIGALILLSAPTLAHAQLGNIRGWCEVGAQPVITSGLTSTTLVQASYPQCLVTVYIHGGGLATIYSDSSSTPLTNPFNASINGQWIFYAANGRYDVTLSGGGLSSPVTFSDEQLVSASGGTAVSINSVFASAYNFINSASLTWSVAGGNVSATVLGGTGSVSVNGTPVTNPNFINTSSNTLSVAGSNISITGTPLNVNGTPVPSANLQNSASVTFSISGSNVQANSTAAVASPANCVQLSNAPVTSLATASAHGICFGVDNTATPALLTLPIDLRAAGPNPYVDLTFYGGRAVTSIPTTTISCSSGLATATVASSSGFQNGDGVVAYGCGASVALSTPGAPTVTPSLAASSPGSGEVVNAPAGSTTRSYKIVARDKNGGLTVAGSAGTTTTGVATLGTTPITITSLTRTNNQVAVVMAAPTIAAVGAVFCDTGSTDASFSGCFLINGYTDNEHFTFLQGMDTRGGATASATGGTGQTYAADHLSWSAVSGAWQYYICLGSGANPIGVTFPGLTTWDYFGATYSAAPPLPDFTAGACTAGASTNDYLSTTIVSGAGTTSLTLASTASQSTTNTTFKFDDGPALYAAWDASRLAGSLHIPAATNENAFYPITSHQVLPSPGSLTVLESGSLKLEETVEIPNTIILDGVLGGDELGPIQFSWSAVPLISVDAAYPGIYMSNGGDNVFRNLEIVGGNNSFLMDFPGGFNDHFYNVAFLTDSNNNGDYLGVSVYLGGVANVTFDHTLFSSGASTTFYATLSPTLFGSSSEDITCKACFFVGRGFLDNVASVMNSGHAISFEDTYGQAVRTPMFMFSTNEQTFVRINKATNDTSPTAMVANWGSNPGAQGISNTEIYNVSSISAEAGGFPGIVTGNEILGLREENDGPASPGQNVNMFRDAPGQNMNIPVYSPGVSMGATALSGNREVREPMHFPAQHTLYWDLASPSSITATVAAGGALPADTWTYFVSAVGIDGGVTTVGASTTCTTSLGNQTCNVAWTGVPGAKAYILEKLGVSNGYFGDVFNCVPVTTNSCSDAYAFPNNGNFVPPSVTGTGAVSIGPTGLITPAVFLYGAVSSGISNVGTLGVTTLTAARTYTLPDASGTVAFLGANGVSSGSITLSGGAGSHNFSTAYGSAPNCAATDGTSAAAVKVTSSTTAVTIAGTGTDVITWVCSPTAN